jgi:hypothetical protein
MRKLIGMTLALFALLALLVTVAYAFPLRHAVPPLLRELHLTDCQPPCWAGITVGETTLDDAYQRLTDTFAGRADATLHRGGDNITLTAGLGTKHMYVAALYASRDGTITQISLVTDRVDGLMMADVVNALGPPTCLQRNIANYESPAVQFAVVGSSRYSPSRIPVNTITIRRGNDVDFFPRVCIVDLPYDDS